MEWVLIAVAIVAGALLLWWIPGRLQARGSREAQADPRERLFDALTNRSVCAEELIDLVRPHAPHERWLFDQLAQAADALDEAMDRASDQHVAEADRRFVAALEDVLALVEVYPDLEGSAEFAEWRLLFDQAAEDRHEAIGAYAKAPGGLPAERWA